MKGPRIPATTSPSVVTNPPQSILRLRSHRTTSEPPFTPAIPCTPCLRAGRPDRSVLVKSRRWQLTVATPVQLAFLPAHAKLTPHLPWPCCRLPCEFRSRLSPSWLSSLSFLAASRRPKPNHSPRLSRWVPPGPFNVLMLPFLEVAHLPSSASFYSAVTQPLGLRYLSVEDDGPSPSIVYGDPLGGVPVFELRQIATWRGRDLKPSYICLSAPSAQVADDVYDFALRANPEDREGSRLVPHSASTSASTTRTINPGGKTRVNITDFDGNIMEIVYHPHPEYSTHYGGSTLRRTQSTSKEASRILDWNYGVASSELPPQGSKSGGSSRTVGRRPYSGHSDGEPYSSLRRSVTDGPTVYEPMPSPRQNSNGLSTGTVVGALLGVAAGAAIGGALTYSKVKADRSRAPRQDFDAPALSRRSTLPDPYGGHKGRYVEVERAVAKVRYPEDYVPRADYRPAPDYAARYSQVGGSRSREVEDIHFEETRGRHSSSRSRVSTRARSEAASNRAPLALTDAEHRSHISSRSLRHPPVVQRSYTYNTPEPESYVSARSHRSENTVRGGLPAPGESMPIVSRSRAGSRMTTTTVKVGGGSGGRAGTYVSARGVPLPPSGVGSSHARWEDDDNDDLDSVAPSDSISCVGSRRSGRAYR